MDTNEPRITLDPAVLAGKPIIRGTRIPVELVFGLLAEGWTEAAILDSHPHLTRADIQACLAYARLCKEQPRRGEKPLNRAAIDALIRRFAALPDLDYRSPDEIVGYDEAGLWR